MYEALKIRISDGSHQQVSFQKNESNNSSILRLKVPIDHDRLALNQKSSSRNNSTQNTPVFRNQNQSIHSGNRRLSVQSSNRRMQFSNKDAHSSEESYRFGNKSLHSSNKSLLISNETPQSIRFVNQRYLSRVNRNKKSPDGHKRCHSSSKQMNNSNFSPIIVPISG